jgi:anti-anti-sigma factor
MDEDGCCYTEWDGQECTIYVEGELDFGTSPQLDEAIGECLRSGARKIWLDLSAVSFIDSEAIKVILKAAYGLFDREGFLFISACSSVVFRTISLLGLNKLLDSRTSTGNHPAIG